MYIRKYTKNMAAKWCSLTIGQKNFVIIAGSLLNLAMVSTLYMGISAGAYLASIIYSSTLASIATSLPPLKLSMIASQKIWVMNILYLSYKAKRIEAIIKK